KTPRVAAKSQGETPAAGFRRLTRAWGWRTKAAITLILKKNMTARRTGDVRGRDGPGNARRYRRKGDGQGAAAGANPESGGHPVRALWHPGRRRGGDRRGGRHQQDDAVPAFRLEG